MTTNRVWSKWTVEDEAKLVELQARKLRIMDENKAPLRSLVAVSGVGNDFVDQVTDGMIQRADSLVDALMPFCQDDHQAVTKIAQAPSALEQAQAAMKLGQPAG